MSSLPALPTTIDGAIARLDAILDETHREASRMGYFPALYRAVTAQIRNGVEANRFDSPERMARLALTFANRYLQAYQDYRAGKPVSRCWQCAFDATKAWRPTVLQHLLLAINAHINLDLGIAAAQTGPGTELPALKADFDRINDLLAGMVDGVERELARVWPTLAWLDRLAGRIDENVTRFSIDKARDEAWRVAERLARLAPAQWGPEIEDLDRRVGWLGALIRRPGIKGSTLLMAVRLGERGTVAQIIDVLRGQSAVIAARSEPVPMRTD